MSAAYLKPEEIQRLADIEAALLANRRARQILRAEQHIIRTRGCKRMGYARESAALQARRANEMNDGRVVL